MAQEKHEGSDRFALREFNNLFNTLFSFGQVAANVGTWSYTGGWVDRSVVELDPIWTRSPACDMFGWESQAQRAPCDLSD